MIPDIPYSAEHPISTRKGTLLIHGGARRVGRGRSETTLRPQGYRDVTPENEELTRY
jgi:hypothetical protein